MIKFNSRPALALLVCLVAPLFGACAGADVESEAFDVVEATIPEMQRAMEELGKQGPVGLESPPS